jgi:hypothetical protein
LKEYFLKKEKEIPGGGAEGGCGVRPLEKRRKPLISHHEWRSCGHFGAKMKGRGSFGFPHGRPSPGHFGGKNERLPPLCFRMAAIERPFRGKKTARKPGRDRFSDGLTKSGKAGGRSIL